MGSSRVGAVFERREREQKRSGGEGGGSANILVRGIKCSVAFVHRFRFENHWQLLQHLDRRSQAEQSKIAGIGLSERAASVPRAPVCAAAMAEEKVFLDANSLYMDSFKLARAIWDDGYRPTVRTLHLISSDQGSPASVLRAPSLRAQR